jgi:glycosyltransferase involved in cell wall biosynthesis
MISSPQGMAGEIIPFANGKADPVFAAETLQRWIEEPAVYASVKKNTSGAFEKFNMKKIASQYLNVFKEVIDQYRK